MKKLTPEQVKYGKDLIKNLVAQHKEAKQHKLIKQFAIKLQRSGHKELGDALIKRLM